MICPVGVSLSYGRRPLNISKSAQRIDIAAPINISLAPPLLRALIAGVPMMTLLSVSGVEDWISLKSQIRQVRISLPVKQNIAGLQMMHNAQNASSRLGHPVNDPAGLASASGP
jgi:hypothetical protein